MKLYADHLRDALKLLKPVYRSNKHVDLWNRVLVEYDGEHETTLTATNGDVWMQVAITGNADSTPLKLVIDPLHLDNILKSASHSIYLTLDETNNERIVVSRTDRDWSTEILNYSAEDFPPHPEYEPSDTSGLMFYLLQHEWERLKKRVFPYAATDDSRPVLECVYFEQMLGNVFATAADGFRLSHHCLTDANQAFDPFLLRVPHLKMIPAKARQLNFDSMGADSNFVLIEFSTQRTKKSRVLRTTMWVRKVEGHFPDYTQIIPTAEQIKGSCVVPVWLIEEAAQVKNGGALLFKPGHAELSINDPNVKVPNKQTWDNVAIRFLGSLDGVAFNPQYLNAAAQELRRGSHITIEATGKHGTCAAQGCRYRRGHHADRAAGHDVPTEGGGRSRS